jgi:hypothetical protein
MSMDDATSPQRTSPSPASRYPRPAARGVWKGNGSDIERRVLHHLLRRSPGEANRAEAAVLAWTNEVAFGNSQIVTHNLLVRHMARALERFDQKKAADLNYYTYRGPSTLAGGDWRTAPPDPSEALLR